MALIRWKPFEDMEKMLEHHTWDLAADVYEQDDHVIAKMHVPGINPDDIEIDVEADHIHVYGERKNEEEIEEKNYYKKEICLGGFERIISLPCSVKEDDAIAECTDGILTITMHKASSNHKAGTKVKVTKK